MSTTFQSDVGTIKTVLLKHSRDAFLSDEVIAKEWQSLNYINPPNFSRAVEEYENFVKIFENLKIEIHFLPPDASVMLDSIYVRDASVMCNNGAILCNMGKAARRGEPTTQGSAFRKLGIPVHGTISGEGRLEGGDVVWLSERTVAVGLGYRTNDEGIRQLRALLADCIDELIVVPLPHWRGPSDVFHLMSIISPIDNDLAVVYSKLLPVPFYRWLRDRGIKLLEVPDDEFEAMACNILTVAPRKCIMLSGNPRTKAMLEAEGVEVVEYDGEEISRKGAGGPTCLTRPILLVG